MGMFGSFAKIFGVIKVKTIGNQVRVTGIDGTVMARHIARIWETNLINKMMFTHIDNSSFSLNSFFLPDLLFILIQMQHDPNCKWAAKRSVDKINEGIIKNTWMKCSVGDIQSMVDPSRLKLLKWKPLPHQLEFLDLFGDKMPRYDLRGMVLGAAPGTGKAAPLDSLIKTPTGWVRMGDIQLGQLITTPDGSIAPVVGIYPQGKKKIYRIEFDDGRSVQCCDEHLWKVYCPIWNTWRIITLSEIMGLRESSQYQSNLFIPLITPLITTDALVGESPYSYAYNLGKRVDIGYIPDCYQDGSPGQKREFIQGLLDAIGKTDKFGHRSLTTINRNLAHHFQEMIRSLGGWANISNPNKDSDQIVYQIDIRLKEDHPDLKLAISTIEYVGELPAQCIAVDHPDHLYITDDYIVTHNTFTDIMVATCVIPPSIAEVKIIISPKKALHLVWEKTLKTVFKKPPTFWCSDSPRPMPIINCEYYLFNFEALDKALDLARQLKTRNVRYFVVVDESHNFADPKSNRTQKLVDLQTLRDDIYFIWTSGSPILKSAAELTSFLKGADPRFDADAERRFKRIYSAAPGRANEIFNHRLGKMIGFIVGKSVVSDTKPTIKELPVKLPPSLANKFLMTTVKEEMKEFIKQRLEFYKTDMDRLRKIVNTQFDIHYNKLNTRAQRKEFDAYLRNVKILSRNPDLIIKEVSDAVRSYERRVLIPSMDPRARKEFRSALSAVKNIKLKVRGEALGTILGKRRSECAAALGAFCKPEEIIKNSLSKTLFFASSVLPIKLLYEDLENKGFRPLMVYGSTNSQLNDIMEQFDTDPNVNPICATMQSLSEAVPVTAASTIVLLNRPWRDAVMQQVIARADRLGQKYQVTVYEVTLDTGDEPNVSSTTDAILAEVRELISVIVGPEFISYNEEDKEVLEVLDNSNIDPSLIPDEL